MIPTIKHGIKESINCCERGIESSVTCLIFCLVQIHKLDHIDLIFITQPQTMAE